MHMRWVAFTHEHGNRTTHGITHCSGRGNAQLIHNCNGVIGTVFKRESIIGAQPATMPAMIDGDY